MSYSISNAILKQVGVLWSEFLYQSHLVERNAIHGGQLDVVDAVAVVAVAAEGRRIEECQSCLTLKSFLKINFWTIFYLLRYG